MEITFQRDDALLERNCFSEGIFLPLRIRARVAVFA
jgi:hypothetical protein